MNEFLEELKSQAQALRDTYSFIMNESKPQFLKVKDFINKGGITKLIFTGMGSSFISSFLPYYILNQNGIATEIREAGEFLFNTFPQKRQESFKDIGIVIISQSGESGEIRELLKNINSIDAKPLTIGITNNPDSYLAYMTELQIFINIINETSITSKTYVCTLLILYVMAKTIIGEFFTNEEENEIVENLLKEVQIIFENKKNYTKIWNELTEFFGTDLDFLEILARGSSMTTAHQAALNFKEITKAYSEANSISTFRHGGIECLKDDTKIVILTSDKDNLRFNAKFIDNLINKWTCGKILHITNQEFNDEVKKIHDNSKIMVYKHSIKEPYLAPIMEIIILQLLFYKIAKEKGIEPGVFKYSQKITNGI
jgi:glucosamine 6-phosphate synthetase-like amidotransferase/phosphosugar isomerase protein